MSYGIYYVDHYQESTDDLRISAAIQDAISTTQGRQKGGRVVLSDREYTISDSIVLHSNIIFCGAGAATSIKCLVDRPIIQINRDNDDSSNIEIRDMTLSYGSMNTSNSFHIEADCPFRLKIYNITFLGPGREYSGVLTWNANSTSPNKREDPIHGGPSFPAFMTHIENCLFNCASIWLNDSDSRIINNYIWANSTDNPNLLRYAVRLSNGSINISGNDIVAGYESGIHLAPTCSGVRIENNYFDGSWPGVYTGWCISMFYAYQILILGNTFSQSYRGGINILSSYQITISKNIFSNLNRSGDSASQFDIKIISGQDLTTGHLIEGNQHIRQFSDSQNYAVFTDDNTQATIVNNSLIDWGDNHFNSYIKPPFVMPTNVYAIRKDNRVTSRVVLSEESHCDYYPYQFDEGEAIVLDNSNAQNIPIHFSEAFKAQGLLPKVQDIHVNFIGYSSTSAVVFSIWGINTTGFHIAVRRLNNSSTTDGIFYWRVSLQ